MKYILSLSTILLNLLILSSCQFSSRFVDENNGESILKGIDVSHFQGRVDWEELTDQDIDFVFIKASEGTKGHDKYFKMNKDKAKETGIKAGFYHFFHQNKDPLNQAKHFIKVTNSITGFLPPVLDVEVDEGESSENIIKNIEIWAKEVHGSFGCYPIIYTGHAFYNQHLRDRIDPQYKIWIADYGKHFKYDVPNMIFYQKTPKARFRGIEADVDFDYFYGRQHSLKKLICK